MGKGSRLFQESRKTELARSVCKNRRCLPLWQRRRARRCRARRWYKKGADLGEITAMLRFAECYKNGIGGRQDYEKAMLEYQHIAERINGRGFKHQVAGIGTALYELGNMYLNGLGVQPDLKKAIRYFTLAAKKCNNPQAENKLNELL